ncbi:MAG: flagellar biosynthetic protein FliO [Acidithiobacillus sp.]
MSKSRLLILLFCQWSVAAHAAPSAVPVMNSSPAVFSFSAILELFSALVAVLLVFLGLIWVLRRLQPGLGGGQRGALHIVASLPLGARERLLLIQMGEQQLLLGVTPAGITLLHTLEAALPEAQVSPPAPFAGWLHKAMERRNPGRWKSANAKAEEQHSDSSSP